MRMVIPSIEWLSDVRVNQWIVRLPEDHPLRQQHSLLLRATAPITWTSAFSRHLAVSNGLRILLARGYDSLHQIQDDDLKLLSSRWSKGKTDMTKNLTNWQRAKTLTTSNRPEICQ